MNQWLPIAVAKYDGKICSLRFRDQAGFIDRPGPYFMDVDGRWFWADSHRRVKDKPTHYKSSDRER